MWTWGGLEACLIWRCIDVIVIRVKVSRGIADADPSPPPCPSTALSFWWATCGWMTNLPATAPETSLQPPADPHTLQCTACKDHAMWHLADFRWNIVPESRLWIWQWQQALEVWPLVPLPQWCRGGLHLPVHAVPGSQSEIPLSTMSRAQPCQSSTALMPTLPRETLWRAAMWPSTRVMQASTPSSALERSSKWQSWPPHLCKQERTSGTLPQPCGTRGSRLPGAVGYEQQCHHPQGDVLLISTMTTIQGCYSETGVHIVMDRNFVCLWRRHNCNRSLPPFCADLLIHEINYWVF